MGIISILTMWRFTKTTGGQETVDPKDSIGRGAGGYQKALQVNILKMLCKLSVDFYKLSFLRILFAQEKLLAAHQKEQEVTTLTLSLL